MSLRLFSRRQDDQGPGARRGPRNGGRAAHLEQAYDPAEPLALAEDPLQRHLQLERYGFVVRQRSRWCDHPQVEAVFQAAVAAIDERFALVPEGFVSLPKMVNDYPGCPEEDVETAHFLLARHPVTHAEFQKFVDLGGYEDLDLWPEDIWPHLIDFKDQTGQPGPRYWQGGRHDKGLAEHPVVGVCYYEAAAYARWVGYRLPTEAEWQMAASWRIRSSAHVFRRYPWGDAMDTRRCNIWNSGVGHTVPVTAFESGAAPNGVLQLIGNVWEWTSSDFDVIDDERRQVVGDMLLKGIRGGAFDTYFPAQATSFFRTGLASLARSNNVGFRCVLDLSTDS